ncbi:MAG: hypothetical protein H6765_08665 [Candidatus Peribacteria bacterium]|nr:MAG: hypothetical protein H6765_08665 [Candidatus Peribacteria bacterium]
MAAGKLSNYEVSITYTAAEMAQYKETALKSFQKDMKEPGFRPGQVPLEMVEKKISPEYLLMGQLEEAIHAGTKKLLEEKQDIKFIGTIYDLNREEKGEDTVISFKIDVYPEAKEKNQNWKSIKLDALESEASPEELEETVMNLRRQYAEYQAAEVIQEGSLAKVKFQHIDAAGNQVDQGTVFIGQEEMDEFPEIKGIFVGKKSGEIFEIPYEEKALPPMLHNRKKVQTAVNLALDIQDVRDVHLPEMTPENIQKFFGNEEIHTLDDLKEKIKEAIISQKKEVSLMQAIDKLLQQAQSSFELSMPKTLIDEEMKSRNKSLAERMGGEEGLKKYFEKIGAEEQEKMQKEIETSARLSLEKFFLLRYITEALGIENPDWKTPLDVETKVYEKLTS